MCKYRFIERLNHRPLFVRYALGYLASFLVLVFTKTKREGERNIPKAGPVIIVMNHFSYVDAIFVISAIQKPISFLGASDQKIKWYFFWAPFIYGFIPTNRSEARTREIILNEDLDGNISWSSTQMEAIQEGIREAYNSIH